MRRAFWPLLALCAVLGLTARLWNLDFDQRQHLHPDERFWSLTADALRRAPAPAEHGTAIGPVLDWLDGQRSPANPYRSGNGTFLYGPVSLALARGVSGWLHDGVVNGNQPAAAIARAADELGVPLIDESGTPRFDSGYGVDLVGRLIGALIDTMTIIVIGLIARRVAGRMAGVAAASLYAASILAIQHAHFLGSEPLLGLGCALTVLCALRLDRGNDIRRGAQTGLLVGLAAGLTMAAKLTGIGLVVVPFIGCLALLVRYHRRSDIIRLGAMLVGAAVAFRVLQPSAFNGLGISLSKPFTDDLRRASELATSTAPPSFQWADRTPVLEPLMWLGVFTVGPGVVLAASFGALAMSFRLFGRRIDTWVSSRGHGGLSGRLSRRIPTEFSLMTNVGRWPLVVIAGATVLPFSYIIITSLPTGRYFIPMLPGLYAIAGLGVVAALRWARGLRGFPRAAAAGFAAISVGLALIWGVAFVNGIYGHKNTRIEASEWIAANVPRGSVLSSQAWDDGLPLRLPGLDAEAFTSEQFNMVGPDDEAKVARIAEQIGRIDYVVESSPRIWATVTRMPARFPSTIKFFDGLESGVLGFERVATFRSGLALGPWRLDDSSADEAFSVLDHPEVRIWRKVRTVDRDAVVKVLDPVAASNAVAIDPNRASANGLMLRPDEIAANSRGPTYDAAFATDDSGVIQVIQVIGWFALLELFGLAAFALFVPLLQRLPDGGLGLAKILALSCLSFGLFIAATWFRLALDRTVVVAVVSLFLAVGALSAWRRHALIATMWRERRTVLITVEVLGAVMFVAFVGIRAMNPDLWHPDRGGEKPFELALLTAVLRTRTIPVYDPWFSGGALNYYYGGWLMLSVPARLLRTSPALVMNLALGVFASCSSGAAFSLASGMVNASRTRWRRRSRTQRTSVVAGLLAAAFVLLASNAAILSPLRQRVSGGSAPGERVDWWALSRVIPNSVTITEFPAWSLLYGDVHPHLMGIAALLALAALCVAWHGALTDGRRSHAVTIAMLLGITAGLIRMTNTWDFPLSLGLVAATLGAALVARTPWRRCVLPAAVLLITVIVVWSPYTGRGEIFDSAFDPATLRTPPSSWLEHFGPFAAIAVFVIALHLAESFAESRVVWWSLTNAHLTVLGLSMIALGYIALRPGFEVFEITAALTIGCAWVALRCWQIDTPRSCSQFGPLGPLAMAIGWLIQACVEMLTVRNDAGRMNTVFKFWFESWVVLAVGGAVVVAEQMRTRMRRRLFGLAFVGFALFVSAAFWWMSTPVRMDDRVSAKTLSLNGEAYLRDDFIIGDGKERFVPADDLPLINWIRANVRGIRVIAEAPGNDYRWTARISWFTGLPTPIGWSYHETQQRRPYAATIEARRTDLNELYTTTDPEAMARVLSRYSVAFVVFGTQERLIASDSSATALRAFPCLDVVTESDRSSEDGVDPNELFVAAVDAECVIRLRPPLAPPPPSS